MNPHVSITTLIENTTSGPLFSAEHGLSFWIEYGNRHILFDTGQSDLLIQNAKALHIDLAQADAIILSHGHYDHTGGLATVLNIAPEARIYLHPAAIEPKYSRSRQEAYPIGMPDPARKALRNRKIIWTESPTHVCDGMGITGQVPRVNSFEDVGELFFLDEDCQEPDPLLEDQALFIESPMGLIVVFGCAHAGVVNTLQRISDLNRTKLVYAVMGGMHLMNADSDRIEKTIAALREYNLQKIGPAHCTGENVIERMRSAFPKQYFECSVGKRVNF